MQGSTLSRPHPLLPSRLSRSEFRESEPGILSNREETTVGIERPRSCVKNRNMCPRSPPRSYLPSGGRSTSEDDSRCDQRQERSMSYRDDVVRIAKEEAAKKV